MKTFKNSIGMTFVLIPEGEFLMGLVDVAEPIHKVYVSPFWMSATEVTNEQFERYQKRPRPAESMTDNQPVTNMTWQDAADFCHWLAKRERKPYRLPREAEWEYAARGGLSQKAYPWGDSKDFRGRATLGVLKTTPVASYEPNGFGLFDMSGNVSEWVSDYWERDYYAHSPTKNPQGPIYRSPPKVFAHNSRGGSFSLWDGRCGRQEPNMYSLNERPEVKKTHDVSRSDGRGIRVVMSSL